MKNSLGSDCGFDCSRDIPDILVLGSHGRSIKARMINAHHDTLMLQFLGQEY